MSPTVPPSPSAVLRDPTQWPLINAYAVKGKPPGAVSMGDLQPFLLPFADSRINWIRNGELVTFENVTILQGTVRFERFPEVADDDASISGVALAFPGQDKEWILGGVTFPPVFVPPGGAVRIPLTLITLTPG